ncbi:MAG: hypothetical protein IJ529_06310 [Alphaproteobacteria bacterium]|nr:hypothetical protein [Alphaproteobacteria bacterium]MBQ9236230.1 hypothetical protein [Alphaproteobacteria bacterium]
MKIRAYQDGDLDKMIIQQEQSHELATAVFPKDISFTFEEDGEVLGVVAVVKVYDGRGIVTSFISADAGRSMLQLVRIAKELITDGMYELKLDRLEMSVLAGFQHGERFAKMLGFEYEGTMRNYYKGRDYKLFAKIRRREK